MSPVKPFRDNVLIRELPGSDMSESGLLFLPKNVNNAMTKGEVVELGTGEVKKNGVKVPFEFSVGDHVLYHYGNYQKVQNGDETLFLVPSRHVLVVLDKEVHG